MYEPTAAENELSRVIIDAAYQVHRALGPGLMESVYEKCLVHELQCRGVTVSRQVPIPVVYRDMHIDNAYRIDVLVGDSIIVEIKATGQISPIFEAQLLTYMKLSGRHLGLLINFHVARIKDGIRRMVV